MLRRPPTKYVIIVATTAVVGIFLYTYFHSKQNSAPSITSPATSNQKAAGADTKAKALGANRDTKSSVQSSGSDTPPAPTPIEGSNKSSVSVTITSSNQTNDTLMVRAMISVIDSAGQCNLTLSKSGAASITMTAATQPQASISTCQGFNVPLSSLESSGKWTIKIDYSSPAYIGSASTVVEVAK